MRTFVFLKKFSSLFIFLLILSSVKAQSMQSCYNSSYMQKYTEISISEEMIPINELIYCDAGCSSTFNACRFNYIIQIILVLLTISFFLLVCSFGFRQSKGIGLALGIISVTCFILLSITDFFSTMWRIFLLSGVALVAVHTYGKLGEEE